MNEIMNNYRILNLQECPKLRTQVADWFHQKWKIPADEYLNSIDECLTGKNNVPQWYIVLSGNKIIGGVGVIANDFHQRKDLTPNVCALYVEEKYRRQGIARQLLEQVCRDMRNRHLNTLYLVTDHISFYEQYGWQFFCMVQEENSNNMIRMYQRKL